MTNLEKIDFIDKLNDIADKCNLCGLNTGEYLTVPGVGSVEPDVFICLEAPAEAESNPANHPAGTRYGVPAIGPAGSALQQELVELGFGRYKLHVTNTLLHKTPKNRPPMPAEKLACSVHLKARLLVTRPKVILALGKHASEVLRSLGGAPPLGEQESHRGKHFDFCIPSHNLTSRVFSTYHPSYALLRNPPMKPYFIEDLKEVLAYLEGDV